MLAIVLVSILIGFPVFFIWGGIFALQIISHLPLYAINFPLNEHKFLAFLNRVVSFELFVPKPLLDYGFTRTSAYNKHFERLGYSTSNIFENLGALPLLAVALFCTLLLLKICLVLATKMCKSPCPAKVNNFFSWARISNFFTRLFLVTFFEFAIAIFVGLRLQSDIKDEISTLDTLSVAANYICFAAIGLFILYVGFFTVLKGLDLSEIRIKEKAQKENDGKASSEAEQEKVNEGQPSVEANRPRRTKDG